MYNLKEYTSMRTAMLNSSNSRYNESSGTGSSTLKSEPTYLSP